MENISQETRDHIMELIDEVAVQAFEGGIDLGDPYETIINEIQEILDDLVNDAD